MTPREKRYYGLGIATGALATVLALFVLVLL